MSSPDGSRYYIRIWRLAYGGSWFEGTLSEGGGGSEAAVVGWHEIVWHVDLVLFLLLLS